MQFVLKHERVIKKEQVLQNNIMRNIESVRFFEKNDIREINSEKNLRVKEYLNSNLKEFLKLIMKIFKDNEKTVDTLKELSIVFFFNYIMLFKIYNFSLLFISKEIMYKWFFN